MAVGGVLTDSGKMMILRLIGGVSGTSALTYVHFGSGSTTPVVTDTAMESSQQRNSITSIVYSAANKKMTVRGILTSGQANGTTISEIGAENDDATKILASHHVVEDISKTSAKEFIVQLTYDFG